MKTIILAIAILVAQVTHALAQDVEATILIAHNTPREQQRIQKLVGDRNLDAIAQAHANWMVANRNLTHQSLNKIMRTWRTGGENIACGQRTEAEVLRSWINSSGHRANILNRNFTHVGFGIAVAADGTVYWCVNFGG